MSTAVIVHKGRRNVFTVDIGEDISLDSFVSEIRTYSGELIVTWDTAFDGDGTDGKLVLTLDDSVTAAINHPVGRMDIKMVRGGNAYAVFDRPFEVEFRETVTQ